MTTFYQGLLSSSRLTQEGPGFEVGERLDEFALKSIKVVLEQIYVEHNSDLTPVRYKLSLDARDAFFKFASQHMKKMCYHKVLYIRRSLLPSVQIPNEISMCSAYTAKNRFLKIRKKVLF